MASVNKMYEIWVKDSKEDSKEDVQKRIVKTE